MGLSQFAFSSWTFDASSGTLKRNGRNLRIPPQEALLLTILLERAGTVVSREEIQRLLWPDGDLIDQDHAINRAVNHLRMVLRDSSQKSRFIETFPKRGYCFREPVTLLASESRAVIEPQPIVLENPPLEAGAIVATGVDAAPVESAQSALASAALLSQPEILPRNREQMMAEARSEEAEKTERAGALEMPTEEPSTETLHLRWRKRFAAFIRRPLVFVPLVSALLIAAAAFFFSGREEAHVNSVSIGVAPLETQGVGADHLGESFRLDLLDSLSELPTVQVRGSHSLDHQPHDDSHIRQLSQELNLDALLLGKLSTQNDRCVFQFELVRGKDSVHLASFEYSGTQDELATIRDRLQRDLYLKLQSSARAVQAVRGSTQNPLAYETYLHARELAYQRTRDSLFGAIQEYTAAIKLDPYFARAYAGLATAHLAIYDFTYDENDHQQAKIAARKALELDPGLAEAHALLGNIAYKLDWEFVRGEAELRRAQELDPHQSAYHAWLAQLLALEGRFDESLHQIDLAHADDPLWPQVYNMEIPVAGAARNYDRALSAAQRFETLVPDNPRLLDQIGWTLFGQKRFEEASAEWRRSAVMQNDPVRIAIEDRSLAALRKGGVMGFAAVRLDASLHSKALVATYPMDFDPAEWYAYLHDNDQAIAILEKTVERHDPEALDLAVDPMFDNLHRDPRFLALLARVGLKLPASYPSNGLRASLK